MLSVVVFVVKIKNKMCYCFWNDDLDHVHEDTKTLSVADLWKLTWLVIFFKLTCYCAHKPLKKNSLLDRLNDSFKDGKDPDVEDPPVTDKECALADLYFQSCFGTIALLCIAWLDRFCCNN